MRVAPITTQGVIALKTFADFEHTLGPDPIWTHMPGCGTSHYAELQIKRHWTSRSVFCVNPDGTLTLRVVAAQFRLKSSDENVPLKENATTAESVFVREGVFTPAKPDSPEELRLFPSEDEKESRIRARLMAELERQPEPLRAFLRAKMAGEAPFRIALEKAKSSPDPELFRQMMARTRSNHRVVVAISDKSRIGDWAPDAESGRNQIGLNWLVFFPPEEKFSDRQSSSPEVLKLFRAIAMALPEIPPEPDSLRQRDDVGMSSNGAPRFVKTRAGSAGWIVKEMLEHIDIAGFPVDSPFVSYTDGWITHAPGDEKRALIVLRDRLLEEIGKKEKALRAGGS